MTLGERTRRLEAQVEYLTRQVHLLEERVFFVPQPAAPDPSPQPQPLPLSPPPTAPAPAPAVSRPSLDVTPSRVLAVAGGFVLLLGLGYLLRYAVIRGWLGPEVRVALALAGSAALGALGIRLERSADTRVVGRICTATASAGAYAAVVAATVLYHFVPAGVGLLAASAVAGAAIARGAWTRTPGIAALGMGGALLSPVLVEADGVITLGLLTVALAAGLFVAVRHAWPALTGLAFVLVTPQLWIIAADRAPGGVGLLVASACAGMLLVAAIAAGEGKRRDEVVLANAVATANALSIACLGYTVLSFRMPGVGAAAAGWWLIAISGVHLGAGLRLARRDAGAPLAAILIVVAAGIADWAVLELVEGYAATVFFGATAAAGALALHRDWLRVAARYVVVAQIFVLAVHALTTTLGEAPLGSWEAVLFVLGAGVAAVAFAALVPAEDRDLAVAGGATLVGLGVVRLLLFEAPPASLLSGAPSLLPALISCAVLAAAALVLGRLVDRTFGIAAAASVNYGLSLAAVALDPAGAGLVALTTLWAAGGGVALVAGRRLHRPDVRRAGGALLLAAAVKAAFVDTMLLDGSNRAAALLLCGSVLVATAVAEARSVGRPDAVPTP